MTKTTITKVETKPRLSSSPCTSCLFVMVNRFKLVSSRILAKQAGLHLTQKQMNSREVFSGNTSQNVSFVCGNKMPTRCNRGFYCRSYCLLNMFRAPLCPSSGAQEYYTVVAACVIWCCGFQVVGLVWSWRLCVRFAECSILQTGHITLSSTPDQQLEKPQHEIPQAATTV